MKLSFSRSSKQSSSKPNTIPKPLEDLTDSSEKTFLTEFDPSKTLISNPTPKKLVIPPKQNEWRSTKKMKNLDLPPIHSDGKPLEFEMESSDIAAPEPGSDISYGLNVRQQQRGSNVNGNDNFNTRDSVDSILLKKLRNDIDKLNDDEGFENYDEVPVEGFGEALLAGYGWKQGMGVGRNAKEDVKVIEYKRRTAKEGLGFTDKEVPVKLGTENGIKKSDEGKSKGGSLSFGVGKEVRVIHGRELGSKGRVIEVLSGGESLILRLSRSEEEVNVRANEVAELGSLEEEKCLKNVKELKIQRSKEDSKERVKKGKDSSRERKESKKGRDESMQVDEKKSSSNSSSSSRVSWLTSHIRVRIVSKSFKGGRFYLKKGEVVDVVGPMTCDISMDEGREIIQGVDQRILETALPRRGGPVLVLFGKYKGAYGSLVEKDTERESGVVQDADTRELLNVKLEQIAEYVGDPSYLGY
ncbi:protein MOS2 [Amaranthus tricolor]|uniref:protein MOS2 n=1 Tax=Amaranthus tricolor TaxID=29722 RepID=UPI0025830504|nr:protein MOS2 [Amaranthus tricolor]XP_057536177.1 protein MOS2 [Amaranthus tricolor]XP_057536178.1 protein MOS2 [Amaranthus tricolor]XP_057536179.1 protein MOS2 [Amaranthus tricolor]XP_057536181.1 protein MOS2 [Amaranthus tricolor]XP_057536182.1 protein MOS2 [Amaranthus tricolor]